MTRTTGFGHEDVTSLTVAGAQVALVGVACFEALVAVGAVEWRFSCVPSNVLLK